MTVQTDLVPLKAIHHLEFWVGNAKQAEYYYRNAFGFSRVAYAGPETGVRDRASYVLQQGKIVFVLTTPLDPQSAMARHITAHGDGVRDIAFDVDDAESSFQATTSRGGGAGYEPREDTDEHGAVRRAGVCTYGETIHSFIDRSRYRGPFLPGYVEDRIQGPDAGLLRVDHIVGKVALGQTDN